MPTTAFLADFMRDVARGDTTRFLDEQKPPMARWQALEDVLASPRLAYNQATPGSKIILGAIGDRLIGLADDRHQLTVGGTRSGKSVTLTANLLHYPGSAFVIDPKGELARITAQRRKDLGQAVFIVDPFENAPERLAGMRARFNPLTILKPGSRTFIEDAGLIADALVVAGGKDPHWDDSARNFIEGVILHVATDPEYEGARTLLSVRAIVRDALRAGDDADSDERFHQIRMLDNAFRLKEAASTLDIGESIEGAAQDFFGKPANERGSVLSTAQRHTKFLDYGAMRDVLSGHDFDLDDLKRAPRGQTVYVCLPANRLGPCSRWLRLFINLLLEAMERVKEKPAAPVLACLDEF